MFSITFSKGKCSAKQNVMQKCIWCQNAFWRTFSKGKCSAVQKCIWCQNAFWHQIHFPLENVQLCKNAVFFALQKTKCYKCIWCVHFVTQNVTNAFWLCKNAVFFALQKTKMRTFCNTKCYKCIFATHHIFLWKMFSCAKMHLMRCKNAFLHQMHLCCAKMHFCTASNAFLQRNAYIFLWKMFSCAKMHLMLCKNKFLHHILLVRCQNAFVTFFDAKMHFCKTNVCKNAFDAVQKCIFASHFVCKNAFLHQQNVTNAFWRTFSFGKCSAYIFQRKMFSKTKCYKCIWCCAKMHFCITFCFAKMHFCINKMLQMHFGIKCRGLIAKK